MDNIPYAECVFEPKTLLNLFLTKNQLHDLLIDECLITQVDCSKVIK